MGKMLGYFMDSASAATAPAKKFDSEQQLRDAQARSKSYSTTDEKTARAAGFKSADERYLWEQARARKTGGTVGGKPKLSNLLGQALSWHPANTLSIASDALARANGD